MANLDQRERALAKLEAIRHPLRLAILTSLSLQPASTNELAAELKAPRGKVRYQLGRLRNAGLVELQEERQRRGVSERIYFARPEPFSEAEISHLSSSQREEAIAGILKAVLNDVLQALRGGAFARRDDFMVVRMPLALDERGWGDAAEIHRRALRGLLDVREESRVRAETGGGPVTDAISFLLLFDASGRARVDR